MTSSTGGHTETSFSFTVRSSLTLRIHYPRLTTSRNAVVIRRTQLEDTHLGPWTCFSFLQRTNLVDQTLLWRYQLFYKPRPNLVRVHRPEIKFSPVDLVWRQRGPTEPQPTEPQPTPRAAEPPPDTQNSLILCQNVADIDRVSSSLYGAVGPNPQSQCSRSFPDQLGHQVLETGAPAGSA